MTPDEWLEAHGKKPYRTEDFPHYYWGTIANADPLDPDSDDFLLPEIIFDQLSGKMTYPNVRIYVDAEAALADFRQVFCRMTSEGYEFTGDS